MSAGDYTAQRAKLTSALDELRRGGAPVEALAAALANLVVLDLDFEQPAAARTALGELSGLRTSGPEAEAAYYTAASRLAETEGEGARATWLSERAVAVARRHAPAYLPHALLQWSDALLVAGREDESGWARAEAVERFESTGAFGHAASALLSYEPAEEGDPSRFHRALALAERGAWARGVAWALRSLGAWHAAREQYLPARHALERAVNAARAADGDGLVEALVERSALEAACLHDDEAEQFAAEALAAARAPHERGQALRAQADALGHQHRHREARIAAMDAARAFDEAGWSELAGESRTRAWSERILVWLHRLPRWLYEPGDTSSLPAHRAHPARFGRVFALLFFVAVVAWLAWIEACAALIPHVEVRAGRLALLVLAVMPGAAVLGVVAAGLWRGRREARRR